MRETTQRVAGIEELIWGRFAAKQAVSTTHCRAWVRESGHAEPADCRSQA